MYEGSDSNQVMLPEILEEAIFNEHDREILAILVNTAILGGLIITYLEPDFPFIYANQAFLQMLGYGTIEEYVAATGGLVNESIHPKDRILLTEEKIQSCVRLGRYDRDHRLQKQDGTYIWVEDRARVFQTRMGRYAIVCTLLDITALMETKQALEREKVMLGYAVNGIGGGVGLYRIRGRKVEQLYASEHLWEASGYDREDYGRICSEDASALIYEEDYERLYQMYDSWVKKPTEALKTSIRLKRDQSSVRWFQLSLNYLGESEGWPLLHVVFRNISQDEAVYDELFDYSNVAIMVVDIQSLEILYANRKAGEIGSRRKDSYFGEVCYAWFAGKERPCENCRIAEIREKGSCECELTALDGRLYHVQMQRINWRGRDAFAEFFTDITAERTIARQKEQEQELLRTRYEEQASQLKILARTYLMTMQLDLEEGKILEITDQYNPMQLGPGRDTLRVVRRMMHNRFPREAEEEALFHILNEDYLRDEYQKGRSQILHRQEHCMPDGEVLWLEYRFDTWQNPDNGHLVTFVSARNITREKLNAAAFDKIAREGCLFIAMVNVRNGKYTRHFAQNEKGAPPEGDYSSVINQSVALYVEKENQAAMRKALSLDEIQRQLAANPSYQTVVEAVYETGTRYHLYEFGYVNQARTVILLRASDITGTVSRERQNQSRIEEALEEARKADAAKSRFFPI